MNTHAYMHFMLLSVTAVSAEPPRVLVKNLKSIQPKIRTKNSKNAPEYYNMMLTYSMFDCLSKIHQKCKKKD